MINGHSFYHEWTHITALVMILMRGTYSRACAWLTLHQKCLVASGCR